MKLFLFILISFVAVSAALSGLWLMSNPDSGFVNLPHSLLNGTPFSDFRLPGILLAILVGGINFLAVFYNIQKHRNRYNWALCGGTVTIAWVMIQMVANREVYWLQFIYLAVGILIILLAFQLKGKWAA